MTRTPIHRLDATALTDRLRRRELRALDLLETSVARIEKHDDALNAVPIRDFERAREKAKVADAELDAGSRDAANDRPLLGLPMTVKDTHEVAGLRTTAGAPDLSDHIPTRSADVVERLEAAGAIIIGKTNTPLYAGDCQTYNELFGTTNNPWNLERTPGGSSGGAATALAAGYTALEVGSDIGGSIRNPAHFCGVFGHKPTWGILSDRGHIPGPPGQLAETDLGVVGPMARSARDLSLALDVLTRVEQHRSGWRLELPAPPKKIEGLRVAAWLDDPFSPVDGAYGSVLENAADQLEAAGATVDRVARPAVDFASSYSVYSALLHSVLAGGFPDEIIDRFADQAAQLAPTDASHAALQMRGAVLSHREWLRFNEMRAHIRAAWVAFFADFDAVLMPVHATVAPPHDQQSDFHQRTLTVNGTERPYLDFLHWVSLATAPGLPATVAPVGTVNGLPAGVQVVAAPFADHTSIAVGGWLEALTPALGPPPGFA